ncbi:MAG: HEAT repeat domain-containing protein [Aquificaceae bacterium]
MRNIILSEYSLKLKPLYGPFHREMLNLGWITETIKSSQRTGYFMLQSADSIEFIHSLDGRFANLPQDFEVLSFYGTLENFIINTFELYEHHRIPLYSEKPLWINLDSISFNVREFFNKLVDFETTGFVLIENRVKLQKGYLLLQHGMVVSANYTGLTGEPAMKSVIDDMMHDVCNLRIYELPEELIAFLLSEIEFAGVLSEFSPEIAKNVKGNLLVVSVSPEKYGYSLWQGGEEIFNEGFEEAPFYEFYVAPLLSLEHTPFDISALTEEDSQIKVVTYDPDNPILYFCPACWSVISAEDKECPQCKYDLTEFHNLPYEYKLIMGLEHPVKEMKINVISTVGKKNLEAALPHLEVMIAKESDPIVLMEIVDTLSRMTSHEAVRLLRIMAQHRYAVVRSRANVYLQKRLKNVER